ncbi:MAG: FkbM family methyltransferase [Minisyncoccia bacterium]
MKIYENGKGQANQDSFVLSILNEKKNGWYVEVGSNDPIIYNNTYLLETEYGWNGVGFEWDHSLAVNYNDIRKNKCIEADATEFDYLKYFQENNFPKQIDYLQLDIEPAYQTLKALKRIPLEQYRFSVITYEHDLYADPENEKIKEESKKILYSFGYKLLIENVHDGTPERIFEDWWIDPKQLGE